MTGGPIKAGKVSHWPDKPDIPPYVWYGGMSGMHKTVNLETGA